MRRIDNSSMWMTGRVEPQEVIVLRDDDSTFTSSELQVLLVRGTAQS